MKRTKEQKGITLIALIITIVVLLILAAVAINSITNDGIIGKAESVKNTYNEAQKEEQAILDYYGAYLAGKTWTKSGNKIIRGDDELTIGQPISYTPDSTNTTTILASDGSAFAQDTMAWKVLGVNKYGQLELISSTATTDTLTLSGKDGYLNGPTRLNTLCNDLYKAEGKATARSLNVEDTFKFSNYTPAPGIKYTYKYYAGDDTYEAGVYVIESSKNTQDISAWIQTGMTSYYAEPWTIDSTNPGPRELEDTYALNVIGDFFDTEKEQWLASTCALPDQDVVDYFVYYITAPDEEEGIDAELSVCWWGDAYGIASYVSYSKACRPVVTLNANVELVEVSGVLTVQ